MTAELKCKFLSLNCFLKGQPAEKFNIMYDAFVKKIELAISQTGRGQKGPSELI